MTLAVRIFINGLVAFLAFVGFVTVLYFAFAVYLEPEPYCTMWEEC